MFRVRAIKIICHLLTDHQNKNANMRVKQLDAFYTLLFLNVPVLNDSQWTVTVQTWWTCCEKINNQGVGLFFCVWVNLAQVDHFVYLKTCYLFDLSRVQPGLFVKSKSSCLYFLDKKQLIISFLTTSIIYNNTVGKPLGCLFVPNWWKMQTKWQLN